MKVIPFPIIPRPTAFARALPSHRAEPIGETTATPGHPFPGFAIRASADAIAAAHGVDVAIATLDATIRRLRNAHPEATI